MRMIKYPLNKKLLSALLSMTIIFSMLLSFGTADVFAASGLPGAVTLTSDQIWPNFLPDYKLTWTMVSGNNATSWKLYEKAGAGDYQVIAEQAVTDNTPNMQKVTIPLNSRADGLYRYYVTLTNSFGTVKSNIVNAGVNVNPATLSKIDLTGVSVTDTQTTISQGTTDFALTHCDVANPAFSVTTNNNSVVSCSVVSGTTLRVVGVKEGRASLKIKENATGDIRYIGVRVRKADGSLPGMPDYISMGGVSEDTETDLNFWKDFQSGDKNKRVDIRYTYLCGGPFDTGWRLSSTKWGAPAGSRAINFIENSRQLGMIPFFVYYNLTGVGSDEGYTQALGNIQSNTFMNAYYQDLKAMLDICKQHGRDDTVGIILEADFLGYLMQNSGTAPDKISAQVNQAYAAGILTRGVDPAFPDTVQGLVNSINYTIRKYYPQAYFGWQFNLWASKDAPSKGLMHWTDQLGIAAGRDKIESVTKTIAAFYESAGVTSYGANFFSVDKYGRDAVAFEPSAGAAPSQSTWFWNADQWNNYLLYTRVIHEDLGLPAILWQLPVGHINNSQAADPYSGGSFNNMTNVPNSLMCEDSAPTFFLGDTFKPGAGDRWNWFTTNAGRDPKITNNGTDTVTWGPHMQEAKDAGVISIHIGAGVADSTDGVGSPPSDDYWWITKVQQYLNNPVYLSSTPPPADTQAPAAPANLVSTGKTDTWVSLSWTAATDNVGVAGYEVYNGSALAASVTDTAATIRGLASNTNYAFTVKAKDYAGNMSAASNPVNVTTDPADTQAPTAPSSLISTGKTDASVSLSWTAATDNVGVTGYEVYNGSTIAASVTGTTATVAGLTGSTAYTFTVKAKDAAGNASPASNAVTVTTNAPDLTVKAEAESFSSKTGTSVAVGNITDSGAAGQAITQCMPGDWTSYSVNFGSGTTSMKFRYANAYAPMAIDIRLGSPTGALIGTANLPLTGGWSAYNTVSCNITNTSGAQNIYLVYGGYYPYLNWFSFTPGGQGEADTQAPTAPTNLTSTGKTDTTVSLSWTAAADNVGVTGYEIYKGSALAAAVTGTTAAVTGLAANTSYTFTVKAKDAAGNISAAGNALNVTTNAASVSSRIEAEAYSDRSSANVGNYGTYIGARPNEWTMYRNVDLTGKTAISINYSNAFAASSVEIRIGSPSGTLIGTISTPLTANWSAYTAVTASVSGASGIQNVYLIYKANNYDNIDWFEIK